MPRKKKSTTQALATYDEELAKLAAQYADQEVNTGGGAFFSTAGGILSYDGNPVPGNSIAVIILDSIAENVFYEDDFDPSNPASPQCFSFGRSDDAMEPHEMSVEAQAERCEDCEWNRFGTASRGRGKACKNRRRLAIISAGNLDKNGDFDLHDDPGVLETSQIGFLAIPPTSINAYGAYVKQLASMKRPPLSVVTRITVEPDERKQFVIVFETLGVLDGDYIQVVLRRRDEAVDMIEQPHVPMDDVEEKPKRRGRPAKANGRSNGRPAKASKRGRPRKKTDEAPRRGRPRKKTDEAPRRGRKKTATRKKRASSTTSDF